MEGPPTLKNLLLTGSPSCGKRTEVRRLVQFLSDLRVPCFYTAEVREHGGGVSFQAVGLSTGRHALLAHVRSKSRLRVGKDGVESATLVPLVEAELGWPAGDMNLVVVDEVGKMELLCPEFVAATLRLLDGPVPVLATVAMRGSGLTAEARTRSDVRLAEVTRRTGTVGPGRLKGGCGCCSGWCEAAVGQSALGKGA